MIRGCAGVLQVLHAPCRGREIGRYRGAACALQRGTREVQRRCCRCRSYYAADVQVVDVQADLQADSQTDMRANLQADIMQADMQHVHVHAGEDVKMCKRWCKKCKRRYKRRYRCCRCREEEKCSGTADAGAEQVCKCAGVQQQVCSRCADGQFGSWAVGQLGR